MKNFGRLTRRPLPQTQDQVQVSANAARLWIILPHRQTVLYQVLNKQVPVPVPVPVVQVPVQVPVLNFQVPVPVQVLYINYRHSVTLQLHKVKVVVSFIFKKRTDRTNELDQTQSVAKHHQSDLLVSTPYQTWIQD